MKRLFSLCAVVASLVFATGCGPKECALDDPGACGATLVCAPVENRERPICVPPVQLQGKVFDLETGAGIEGAQVAARDENGAPVGDVVTTDADGNYTLNVPSDRTDDQGAFVAKRVTLSAAAPDYVRFPSGIRTALPVDTAGATHEAQSDPYVLTGTPVEIGLQPLPEAEQGQPSISGVVDFGGELRSALVVAESTSTTGVNRSAYASANGEYTLFNVPAGTYQVRAYSQNFNYDPVSDVVVAADPVSDVNLAPNATPTAEVSGSIQIVSTTGATSIILAVRSTFDPDSARGEAPAGLRAPEPGTAPNLTGGEFVISGVPDGEYVVLAAFENDGLVRDPDTSLGGTDLQFVTVSGGTATALEGFKVTDAITLVGPGAEGLEVVTEATPTFTWEKYPSTAQYELFVFDSLGNQVDAQTLNASGGGQASLTYAGEPLVPGGVYQWRVYAKDTGGTRISASEDLRGVFQLARE